MHAVEKNGLAEKKRVSSSTYGFNGMEKDDKIKGSSGTSLTTMFRQYDPRIGRWFSVDPSLAKPWESSYVGFGNTPTALIDVLGAEWETDDDKEIAYDMIGDNFDMIDEIDAKIDGLLKQGVDNLSVEQKGSLSDLQGQKSELEASTKELVAMGAVTDIFYNFNKVGKHKEGGTEITETRDGQAGIRVVIDWAVQGDLYHETKHGYQILSGEISDVAGLPQEKDPLYTVDDEVAAKRREFAITGRKDAGEVMKGGYLKITNANWVRIVEEKQQEHLDALKKGIYTVPGMPPSYLDLVKKYRQQIK
ncbi:MAG: hypothetical protein HRT90_06575 [Candidatus Margulisbacteria bacterium]|nr:hypothetical protein [Candidatus Margulisiibacteriota bacterium]